MPKSLTDFGFSLTPMPLLGIAVTNFEAEVARYEQLFGIKFLTFTAGVDYALHYETDGAHDTAPSLPSNLRLAFDTNDMFELVEMPGVPDGFRNIHFRVDDLDRAIQHFQREGLQLAQVIQAGTAREAVFDASTLNGIRLCLMQFEGASFAEALVASPTPDPQ